MSGIVPYDNAAPLRLEQTCNGHIVTPWFLLRGFNESERENWSGRYYQMIAQAKSALATILNVPERELIVTQLNDPVDGPKWRLGTARKCALPKPKLRPPSNPLAIDI